MPILLTIPEYKYTQAAQAIARERRKFDPSLSDEYVARLLKAYVTLGETKQVPDYGKTWQSNNDIIAKIQNAIGENSYARVKSIFDFMEILAARGDVFPNIARPNFAQTQFEQMQQAGHKNDPTTGQVIAKGVHDFFGFAGSVVSDTVSPAITGLWSGMSTPVKIAAVGGLLIAGYVFLKPYIK